MTRVCFRTLFDDQTSNRFRSADSDLCNPAEIIRKFKIIRLIISCNVTYMILKSMGLRFKVQRSTMQITHPNGTHFTVPASGRYKKLKSTNRSSLCLTIWIRWHLLNWKKILFNRYRFQHLYIRHWWASHAKVIQPIFDCPNVLWNEDASNSPWLSSERLDIVCTNAFQDRNGQSWFSSLHLPPFDCNNWTINNTIKSKYYNLCFLYK